MKLESWPLDKIIPYELNSKEHDKEQVAKIATSIKKFGFDVPIVVDKDGVIIKGHGRLKACQQLGLKAAPVLVRDDLTKEQANAARIADNRVAIGGIDVNLLKEELAQINVDDLIGIYDDKELAFLTDDIAALIDDSAFASNLDEAVQAQASELDTRIDEAMAKRIPVSKALGIKDFSANDMIHVTRFMAQIETKTNLKGDLALVSFIQSYMEPV